MGGWQQIAILLTMIALAGCAGRDPDPVQTVQSSDRYADCVQIRAEIDANNSQLKALADEEGLKLAQNMAAGTVGFFTLGLGWFALDAKGAAKKEAEALSARNKYLANIAEQRCAAQPHGRYQQPQQYQQAPQQYQQQQYQPPG